MVITFDDLKDFHQEVIIKIIKVNVGEKGFSYWKDDKWMYYIPFYQIDNLRIYDDEEYSRIRRSKEM